MNIENLQKQIDQTEYWDMPALNIQSNYFNDEIDIYIENDEQTCWKINFLSCYKVSYETDANWRGDIQVKTMRYQQLGYCGHNITVKKYDTDDNFIEVSLHLIIMTMTIICKDVVVEKLNMQDVSFFWQNNTLQSV